MKYLKRLYNYCTKTLFRKALSILLVILILLSSIKFVFLKPNTVLADSLFMFNEGYGTSINDNNGNVGAGTIANAVWKTEELCREGKCLYFDGTGDKITFADDADLDFVAADNFTIEGWFRTPDITSGQRTIIAKHNATAGGYKVYMDSNGYLIFGVDDDLTWTPDDSVSTTTTAFDDNKWHFFSAVKTGTTSITIFVDNIQYQTDSTIAATGTLANADSLLIGIDGDGSSNGFSGFIDEVKIYRSARTVVEIKADYLGETPSRGVTASFGPDTSYISNGLIGYWKMDEANGNPVDSSGNGLTLTNNATTTFVSGKFGNGSEYVPASSQYFSTATTINGVKSVSFWTNPDTTTNYFISLTSGAYITASSGAISATGFTNPTIYVNGAISTTLTQDVWQLVTITSETSINADLFYLGRQGSNYYDGTMDEVRIYNRALSPVEVAKLYSWAPGPIGHWKMDENTGTTSTFDSSTNGFTGTLEGSMTASDWRPGKFGSALNFDNVDNKINAASPASLDNLGPLTFSAWIYPRSGGEGEFGRIFEKTAGGLGTTFYVYNAGPTSALSFQVNYSGTDLVARSGSNAISMNAWNYVTVTWDDSATATNVHLYVNGTEVSSYDTRTNATLDQPDDSSDNLYIGSNPGATRTFDGLIDDAKIYNYVRTSGQIIEDMNAGHPAPGSPVGSAVGHWKFDEGALNTCPVATDDYCDSSINANGLAFSTTTGGFTNSGKFGKAYNGADNVRATRADDADFDFANGTDDFTISTWFNRGGAISAQEYLLDKHATNDGYQIYMDADGDIVCGIGDGTSFPEDTAGTTAANYDDTSWHQAVCVKSGISSLTLYIDGKSVASDTSLGAIADMSNTGKLILGDTNETDGTDEWLGDIDEVKIFRSALTADAIKVLYNQSSGQNMGSLSTDSSNNPSNSSTDEYCPLGQGSACTPPVGHWKMDEGSWTNNCSTDSVFDSSGNGNNGDSCPNTTGPIGGAMGKFGSSGDLDGSDDYLLVADSASLDVTANFTIGAWIYADIGTLAGDKQLVSKDGVGTDTDDAYNFYLGGSSAEAAYLCYETNNRGTSPRCSTTDSVSTGRWHHVAIAFDGGTASMVTLYQNGVKIADDGDTTQAPVATATNLLIGRRGPAATPQFFNGRIDDIRIYNYTRTPAQIAWDYNRGGPVGWWKLDENTGVTANDSAGNSTAGTLTNTPTWATGKFNQAISFAGSNQHVLIGDDSDFDFADDESMSLTTWFKHGAASAQEVILSKYAAAGYKIIMEADGDITCGLDYDSTWTPTDSATSTAATYDDGNWHHIACVKTDATSLALYIDGVLIATDSSITATNTLANADPLYLGIDADGTSNDFTGSLDDVRIYRYPLTIQQIKTIMNNGSAVKF